MKYVILNIYPIVWSPTKGNATLLSNVKITITYSNPIQTLASSQTTQLQNLIVTSPLLSSYGSSLCFWKNQTGVLSKVIDTSTIYSSYSGVDSQEKIRNCIKDFFNNYGITYVTILGDVKQVPIRYAYVPDIEADEPTIPTDLYYADLHGTWDDNHDGIYADQSNDTVVGIPNVYVGRIPASNEQEAQASINKIIGYQQQRIYNPSPSDWTQKFLLAAGTCSGDGFENLEDQGFAILNDYIGNMMSTKNITKLYEKTSTLSTSKMTSALNDGALFLNVAAHGSPGTGIFLSPGWLFYWVTPYLLWYNGYGIADVKSLTNNYRLPVITTMSCSTAALDGTSHSFGETFVLAPQGGSIAYFGSTRTAYGYFDSFAPYYYNGAIDTMIYQTYNQGQTRTGQLWGGAITKYCQSFISNYGSVDWHNAKTIMEYILLGDPTIDASGDFTPPVTTANYNGQWSNSYAVWLSGTDAGTGLAETYYQINNGTLKKISIDGQPYFTQDSANNNLTYWSIDNAGNVETPQYITNIKVDTTPPSGSIIINSGANFTSQTSIQLALTSTDNLSGVSQIVLTSMNSTGNGYDLLVEPPITQQVWNLTSADGLKTIFYEIHDAAGNTSPLYNANITLDTVPPNGTVVINGGQTYTNSLITNLTLSANDSASGINQMRFSNDTVIWSNWESYNQTKACQLPSGDGLKYVYVQFQDNVGLAKTALSTITLDTSPPTANAGNSQSVYTETAVSFDGSKSSDNIGIVSYSWNFGDQSIENGIAPTHTYSQSGKFNVVLTVYDVAGNTDSSTTTITVQPQPTPTPTQPPTPTISPSPSPSINPTIAPTQQPSSTVNPTNFPSPTQTIMQTSTPTPTSPINSQLPTPTQQHILVSELMGEQTTVVVVIIISVILVSIVATIFLLKRRR